MEKTAYKVIPVQGMFSNMWAIVGPDGEEIDRYLNRELAQEDADEMNERERLAEIALAEMAREAVEVWGLSAT